MRWKVVRLLLLAVLVGSLAYNSWKSHSLVHVIWAPLSAQLSPVLPGTRAQPASLQTATVPGQTAANSSARVKAVKIRVKKGAGSETPGKIRVTVSRKEANAAGVAKSAAALPSSNVADSAVQNSLDLETKNRTGGSSADGGSNFGGPRQGLPNSLAADWTGPQDHAKPQGAQVSLQQAVLGSAKTATDSVAATSKIAHGFNLAEQGVQDAPAAAAAVPMAPAGRSCESWLAEADARVYQRDFQRQPITVLEGFGSNNELANCAVPCKMMGGSPAQTADGPVTYDAHFGPRSDSSSGMGLSVVRNMESMTNYPGLAVEQAHADGYDVVVTTRLDSDVPASYLSWAGMLLRLVSLQMSQTVLFMQVSLCMSLLGKRCIAH